MWYVLVLTSSEIPIVSINSLMQRHKLYLKAKFESG